MNAIYKFFKKFSKSYRELSEDFEATTMFGLQYGMCPEEVKYILTKNGFDIDEPDNYKMSFTIKGKNDKFLPFDTIDINADTIYCYFTVDNRLYGIDVYIADNEEYIVYRTLCNIFRHKYELLKQGYDIYDYYYSEEYRTKNCELTINQGQANYNLESKIYARVLLEFCNKAVRDELPNKKL